MTRIDQAFLRSMPACEPESAPSVGESGGPKTRPAESHRLARSRVAAPHFALRGNAAAKKQRASQERFNPEPMANREEAPPSSSTCTERQSMAIDTRSEAKDILPLPTSQMPLGRGNSESAFRPSLEVDAFLVPPICRKMVDRLGSTGLAPVAQALASAARRGCAIGGFVGWGAASGCTTTALSTALLLADRGKRVLLVDAADDTALTSLLGLDLEYGWDTVPDQSLRELVIRSLEDHFDLLPKSTRAAPNAPGDTPKHSGHPLWRRLADLTSHYAFILIDVGSEPAELHAPRRIPEGSAVPLPPARGTADETDLAAACDVLFFVRDVRRRQEADFAPPPGTSPTRRPRTFIIDNFAPGA